MTAPASDAMQISDDEGQEEQSPLPLPKTASDKRRAQAAAWDRFFLRQAAVAVAADVVPEQQTDSQGRESLAQLFEKRGATKQIINSIRAYQSELFEKAKTQNTIAVLPTGSGKTLVAVKLLEHVLNQETEDRAQQKPHRIAFFLVDRVMLVWQQQYVLKDNLHHRIAKLFGNMNVDAWSVEDWRQCWSAHDAVVCTAEILRNCLIRGFIRIQDINLFIFDEAHHAKASHAYARIMKEYWLTNKAQRPRIFGMTASPVDIKDVDRIWEVAKKLEELLDSFIVTSSHSSLAIVASKPREIRASYNPLSPAFESRLFQALKARHGDLDIFKPLFETAKRIRRELGEWCSDVFWSFAFSDRDAKKSENLMERSLLRSAGADGRTREQTDHDIAELKSAHAAIHDHEYGVPNSSIISHKVGVLLAHLHEHFQRHTSTRCLVFVELRATARLLKTLLDHLGGPYLRAGALIGSNTRRFDGESYSLLQQQKTLVEFKDGDINCLFATAVAEEGIDISKCNLIIRFDPCKTMIQNMQSRGRARHSESKMIHLMDGSEEAETLLNRIQKAEVVLDHFCSMLPKDRKLLADEIGDARSSSEKDYETYLVASTGAKLNYPFSLAVLHQFVSTIPHDTEDDMEITYKVFPHSGKFMCEVTLPERATIKPFIGKRCSRKMVARMSAAFQACKYLHKNGLLDDHFLPLYRIKMHHMRNARLALGSKTSNYPMLRKPKVWSSDRGVLPQELYLTVLQLPEWDRKVQPLGLLTRRRLPDLPSLPLYMISGRKAYLLSSSVPRAVPLTYEKVIQINDFTLRVFKDVFNKTFETSPEKMSWWLAPICHAIRVRPSNGETSDFVIDWNLLESLQGQKSIQWSEELESSALTDNFLIDPYHGGRRFFTYGVRPDMKPTDPIPDAVASAPRNAETILEYSSSLVKSSKARRHWDHSQPILEADNMTHRLNVFATPSEPEQKVSSRCFICPEPLAISQLPASIAAMVLTFPATIHRIESYLIALEFANEVGIGLSPDRALEAITKDGDNTGDEMNESINFQRGMGPNYERLEFYGDTFLKMATTIAIFIRQARANESYMHDSRMMLLCNQNLYTNAKRLGYVKYIRSQAFSRRTWYPENLKLLEGKGSKSNQEEDEVHHRLADKTIADVMEAMIGAAVATHVKSGHCDPSCFDDAVKAVTAFVFNDEPQDVEENRRFLMQHDMTSYADYFVKYEAPAWQTSEVSAVETRIAVEVQTCHRYVFKQPKLLSSALTHPSVSSFASRVPSYQRLEFLGDSLLDMAAVLYLFEKYPKAGPAWLTEHKMAIVSNDFMAALCVEMGLHRYLTHDSPIINKDITVYVGKINLAKESSNGAKDYWTAVPKAPKFLADMIESYVGAIFVDSKFNFSEVQRFWDQHIYTFFEDMSLYDTFANNHPFIALRELLGTSMGCKEWMLTAREDSSDDGYSSRVLAAVMVHTTAVAPEWGKSSRYAKERSAKHAHREVEGLTPLEFRIRYGCDCSEKEDEDAEDEEKDHRHGTAI